jgi:hypothetical protein
MSLRFVEGFEVDQGTVDFGRKYQTVVNTGTFNFITGPKVGSAMQAGGSADSELRTKVLVGSPGNVWIVGIRVRAATASGSIGAGDRGGGITLFRGASDQVEIRVHSNGGGAYTWRVYRGATLLGESMSWWDDTWTYWEFKIQARTGTNGSVQIRATDTYHGGTTTFFTLSGVNTANAGVDGADTVRFKFQYGNNGSFDDIYINDDQGSLNNDYLSGDVVVFGASPNGDGARTQWTPSTPGPHFSLVNDPAGSPSDTTKVTSQATGQDELYDYQNLALVRDVLTIYGLMLGTVGGMDTSGTRTIKPLVRSGGTDNFGTPWSWSDTLQHHEPSIYEQNPIGPAAWTKTSIDAAQFGFDLFA